MNMQTGDFERLIEATMAQVGITPAENTIYKHSRLTGEPVGVAGQDADGVIDFYVKSDWSRGYQEAENKDVLQTHTRDRYLFGGLLRQQSGCFNVTVTPRDMWEIRTITDKVAVDIYSSPVGINLAQQALGRRPGVDAFELIRQPGKDDFTAVEWLQGFADMRVPVAGLEDEIMAIHDTNAFDHVQSWITTPAAICRSIARNAAQLVETHGDRLEDRGNRTVQDELDIFAEALDALQGFTRPILDTVIDYAEAAPALNERGTRKAILDGVLSREARDSYGRNNRNSSLRILHDLRIVPEATNSVANAKDLRGVVAVYTRFVAGLLLEVEEVGPAVVDRGAQEQANRKRSLQSIQDAFDYAERLPWAA